MEPLQPGDRLDGFVIESPLYDGSMAWDLEDRYQWVEDFQEDLQQAGMPK